MSKYEIYYLGFLLKIKKLSSGLWSVSTSIGHHRLFEKYRDESVSLERMKKSIQGILEKL